MIYSLKRRAQVVQGEDGAVLIFALIIVTTISLVVGSILTLGNTSLRATVALQTVESTSYAADAAANIAINDLRTGYGFSSNPNENGFDNGLDLAGCFGNTIATGGTDTLSLPKFYPAALSVSQPSSATVECTGESDTGQEASPVPISSLNKPGYAIITLNGPITTTDPLNVHGGVYSNTSITGAVSLDAGDAWAFGACTDTTVIPPATKHCNTGQTIADPNYANDLGGTVPALQTPPTTCTSGVAVFTPGYYDNAATLTAASGLCQVSWFKPGTYYFDFHNNSCPNVCPTSLFGSGTSAADTWAIPGNPPLIGGTPTDASGHVLSLPSTSPTMPGSCQSPITNVNAVGVQFVFGGDSHVTVAKNAQVELCGTYHADRPPIEMYGLKTGSTPTATNDNGRDISNGGSVVSAGSFIGATVGSLKTGGTGASWTTASAAKQTSILTINGFAPTATVPAGAILTAATLHVTHSDGDVSNASPSATVKIGSAAITAAMPITASTASTTANIAITGTNLNTLQTEVHTNGYVGATVAYSVSAKKNNATSTVGPITLDLTYYLPVLRGEAGTCVDGTAPNCQFLALSSTGNNKIILYLQGTTYVPYGDINIILSNFSAEVAKFGIVARQLEFSINNGNPRYTGPIFEIPDNSLGYGYQNTTVDLKVHVCLAAASCSVSAAVALTVRVQLWDPSGSPAPPGRQITVLSWSHSN